MKISKASTHWRRDRKDTHRIRGKRRQGRQLGERPGRLWKALWPPTGPDRKLPQLLCCSQEGPQFQNQIRQEVFRAQGCFFFPPKGKIAASYFFWGGGQQDGDHKEEGGLFF